MNPYSISGILISTTCFTVVFILLKFGNANIHRIWTAFNVVVGMWGIGCILIGISNENNASFHWFIASLAGYFIAPVFYHTTIIFSKKSLNIFVPIGYCYSILSVILHYLYFPNPNFAIIVLKFNSLYYIHSTSIVYTTLLCIWIMYAIMGHIILFKYYKTTVGEERNKTSYFLTGMLIGFSGGIMNIFPMLGINIYPYGNFSIPIYCSIATYAMLKHKLTDINIVFRKTLVYSMLIIIITLTYLLFVVLFEKILQGLVGYKSLYVSLFTSLLIAIFFLPIKNVIQNIIDRYFFHGSHLEIIKQNESLRSEIIEAGKLRSIATLASGIAHEIKNPLTALRTFTEFLPKKSHDKAFISKFSRIVRNEVDRIDNLVHQLLDFARPATPVIERANLNRLVDDTLHFINHRFIEKNISLTKDFSPGNKNPIFTDIDPHQIRQVVFNIFLNSIDAMNRGGNLNVSLKKIGKDENFCEIVITDTGCGISPEDLPHIFDPFFTKKDGGTGLGLSITHQIIVEHKGTIEVESQEGRGTTFKIRLPTAGS